MARGASPLDVITELERRDRQQSARRSPFRVPASFVGFLDMLGVTPSPAQRAFSLVCYDGLDPCDLDGEERELARVMFDGIERFAPECRTEIWTLAGGRAGKTYLFGALRLVHGAYIRDLSSLAPGQEAVALAIAPKDVHRQEIINYQLGAIRSHPELRRTLVRPKTAFEVSEKPEWFVIRRPHDGLEVMFEGGTANSGGYGARGRALTDFLGDEAAFFRAKGVVNDKDIFEAASPRVLPGGQVLGQTTAWAVLGYHYEQWEANFGHPVTAIAARATTTQLRPSYQTVVERERKKNPANARREFDAIPMADAPEIFFSPALIGQCTDSSMPFPMAPAGWSASDPESKAAGADFGFRSNSSALAITLRSGHEVFLGHLAERRPKDDAPLKPSETVGEFAGQCGEYGVTYVTADGHYRESIVEHLDKIGFADTDANPGEVFVRARQLMRDGRVRIPDFKSLPEGSAERDAVERLIKQMKDVRSTPQAGGTYSIKLPIWPDGSHGDLVAAFVLALYRFGGEVAPEEKPKPGTPEWEEAERAKRRAKLRAGKRF